MCESAMIASNETLPWESIRGIFSQQTETVIY